MVQTGEPGEWMEAVHFAVSDADWRNFSTLATRLRCKDVEVLGWLLFRLKTVRMVLSKLRRA
jgi:hypothetical protein